MKGKLVFLFAVLLVVSVCTMAPAVKVYVADYGSDSIWVSDSAAGSTASVLGSVADPLGIAIEQATGNLIVGSLASPTQVLRINKTTGAVMDGSILSGTLPSSFIYGMAFDSAGRLYVVDSWNDWTANDKVMRYTYNSTTGKYDYESTVLAGGPENGYPILGPSHITIGTGPTGNESLWVSSEGVGWVTVSDLTTGAWTNYAVGGANWHGNSEGLGISPNGQYLYHNNTWLPGVGVMEIGVDTDFTKVYTDDRTVQGMAIDGNGNIYVADYRGNRVVVLSGADTGSPVFSHNLFYPNLSGPFGVAVEAIPEPGSLLALSVGMVGMAGFLIRRRR